MSKFKCAISWYRAMDGRIVIRSVMLSNRIAGKWCYRAQGGVAEKITLSHPEKTAGYKEAMLFEGKGRDIIHKISFQRHRRRSWNIIMNSIYHLPLPLSSTSETRLLMSRSTLGTNWIRSETCCRTIRRITYSVGQITFNQHLTSGFLFLRTRGYRWPGASVYEYRRITIWGVWRRVVTRWGSWIFLYIGDGHWRRFDLARSGISVQEVES